MSFASVEFAVLFAGLLVSLIAVRNSIARRLLVLIVSCVFYAWADWRFLGLLGAVTVIDYFLAGAIAKPLPDSVRKRLLLVSVATNLGLLFYFKYFGFFTVNLRWLGLPVPLAEVALPVGISFYTFETLSYVIDVYRRETAPARSLLDYAVFVTFFPRLVAGPIMRARQFLPQLESGIRLSGAGLLCGAQLFAMGAVKKLVIADTLAFSADPVFAAPARFAPLAVWAAVFCYSFQILCDFSGYTDMATGIARMLGITLTPNFRLPYTAQSLTEFWQRWHISLSTWLRDYLYIPLGGNRRGPARTYLNLMATMLLGGLWHGASWNFVIWGGLHGLYLAAERLIWRGRPQPAPWTSLAAWIRATVCFVTVSLTWVFFRTSGLAGARGVWRKLLFLDGRGELWAFCPAPVLVAVLWFAGLAMRRYGFGIKPLPARNPLVPAVLLFAALAVVLFTPLRSSPFIYFRF